MPIEFHCPTCQKRLRTPDGTEGRQATCPGCEAVCTIPTVSGSGAAMASQRPPGLESINPYAAPSAESEIGDRRSIGTMEPRPLQHCRISLTEVLSESWRQFRNNLGGMALFGVAVIAPFIAVMVVAAGLLLAMKGEFSETEFNVILLPFNFVWSIAVLYSSVRMGLNSSRGIQPVLQGTISFGHHIGRIVLFMVVMMLIYLACFGVLGAVAAVMGMFGGFIGLMIAIVMSFILAILLLFYFFIPLVITPFFIVDYDHDLWTSMQLSRQYMKQNVGQTFLLYMITAVGSIPVMIFTLYLGVILVMPFMALMFAQIYMFSTGQYLASGDE